MFGKKETFIIPIKGKIESITKTPDQVFSEKLLGDGFAITPTEGKAYAPFDCTVQTVFPTKHAIGLKSKNGIEVLIHIGLDTVALNGTGLETHVTAGDEIPAGTLLVTFDLDYIKEHATSIVSPIVFLERQDVKMKLKSESESKTIYQIKL